MTLDARLGLKLVHLHSAQAKGGSHQGSMDGSRHGAVVDPALDYTFNMHGGKGGDGGDGDAPYPARNDSTGSFLDDYPGDSPYGSVGGSLVRARSLVCAPAKAEASKPGCSPLAYHA